MYIHVFCLFLKIPFKGMTNKSITYSWTDSFTSPPKDEVLKHHFERSHPVQTPTTCTQLQTQLLANKDRSQSTTLGLCTHHMYTQLQNKLQSNRQQRGDSQIQRRLGCVVKRATRGSCDGVVGSGHMRLRASSRQYSRIF